MDYVSTTEHTRLSMNVGCRLALPIFERIATAVIVYNAEKLYGTIENERP